MAKTKNRNEYYRVIGGVAEPLEDSEVVLESANGIYLKPTGGDVVELPRKLTLSKRRIVLYPASHGKPWPLGSDAVAPPGVPRPADFKTLFGEYLPNLIRRALANLDLTKWQTKDFVLLILGIVNLLIGGGLLYAVIKIWLFLRQFGG